MSLHGYWQHIHPPMWILKANSLSFFCLTGFLRDTHSMKLSNCWSTEQYFSNSTKKKNPIMYDYTAFACIWVFHFVKNIIYIFRHWYPKKKKIVILLKYKYSWIFLAWNFHLISVLVIIPNTWRGTARKENCHSKENFIWQYWDIYGYEVINQIK